MQRPNLRRRVALAGGAALVAAAGVGGFVAMSGSASNVHLTAAPSVFAPVAPTVENGAETPDTATAQQGGQSGAQDSTGIDSTTATGASTTGAEAPSGTEADGAGGHADAAGSTGQDGDFNN